MGAGWRIKEPVGVETTENSSDCSRSLIFPSSRPSAVLGDVALIYEPQRLQWPRVATAGFYPQKDTHAHTHTLNSQMLVLPSIIWNNILFLGFHLSCKGRKSHRCIIVIINITLGAPSPHDSSTAAGIKTKTEQNNALMMRQA